MKNIIKSTSIAVIIVSCISSSIAQDQFKVLLFTKTAEFHHKSINAGVDAIQKMGIKHHFKVDWHEDATKFSDENLEQYAVIIFLNTTGDILSDDQQISMERFIQSGKGFVGIHSASDTEYDWEWYTKMVGMMFKIHPKIQTAKLSVENHNFPGMERMPKERFWTDEYYTFGPLLNKNLNYLLTVDENSYKPYAKWEDKNVESNGMGDHHPMAWFHEYDGGRAFYSALGHVPATFQDDIFLDHLFGGIYWAATGNGIK